MKNAMEISLAITIMTAVVACFGAGDDDDGSGVSCVADDICQPACASDPDCAGVDGGPGGSGGSGEGGSGEAGSGESGSGEAGSGEAGSGEGGSGGSEEPEEKCPSPYRCNPDEKEIGGLMREYKLEKCNPSTGAWTLVHDCSDFGCSCKDVTSSTPGNNYANCSWAGELCTGIEYTW